MISRLATVTAGLASRLRALLSRPSATSASETEPHGLGRPNRRAVAAVAVVAAMVALVVRASPTGVLAVDAFLVVVAVGVVVNAAAFGPWWGPLLLVGVAAATSGTVVLAGVASAALLCGMWVSVTRRDGALTNSVIAGVGANVLMRSEFAPFLGASAVVGVVSGSIVVIAWLARSNAAVRRRSLYALAGTIGFVVLALAGLGMGGLGVRDDVRTAVDEARAGVNLLSAGDYESAADAFDRAAESFDTVDGGLGGPLAVPSRAVPIVSQNVTAGARLSESAAATLSDAASALREVDPSSLRVSGGAIDLAAVGRTAAPLERVQSSLRTLRETAADVRSVWLVNRLVVELDELELEFEREEPRLANAVDAVTLAPALLGGDGERRYLVLFTTPAEARGLGGFVGNYAEVVLDDGEFRVVEVGRRSDLEAVLAQARIECTGCPAEFMNRYGRFGFSSGPGGTVTGRAWSNVTMSPVFPEVAEVVSILYPASGGADLDGVFVMDPYVVEVLMRYTGSVDIDSLGVTVEADSAAQYILRDQYEFAVGGANLERIDALDTLAAVVFSRLQSIVLPEPATLADDFAPLISQRRLLGWSADPGEQALFDRIGLSGSLPAPGADGGFALALTNAGANKIDVFLERSVSVDVRPGVQSRELVASVSLNNTAPSTGLADYVIGNSIGLPNGTSRLFVTMYGAAPLQSVLVDGEPVGVESRSESGWTAHSFFVSIPAGAEIDIEATFRLGPGPVGAAAEPTTFDQPLAQR
ncbi:MAG: DUF4012 domain-containing protein [Ilumatobacter sp.]